MMTASASAAATVKAMPRKPRPSAACEQIFDQMDDAEPDAEQHQPAESGPEQCAPAKAARNRNQRCIDGDRQQRRIGLRRDIG